MIEKLLLLFKYGPELEDILADIKRKKVAEKWESEKHRLDLCEKHQPKNPGAHYAEANCDYCNLHAELKKHLEEIT